MRPACRNRHGTGFPTGARCSGGILCHSHISPCPSHFPFPTQTAHPCGDGGTLLALSHAPEKDLGHPRLQENGHGQTEAAEQAAAEGWEEEQEASRFSTSSLPDGPKPTSSSPGCGTSKA